MKNEFMYNKEDLKVNREVISEMLKAHREEMLVLSATVAEVAGTVSAKDYMSYAEKLSHEELVGNYSTALLVPDAILAYLDILDGTSTFDEYVEEILGDLIFPLYTTNKLKLLK